MIKRMVIELDRDPALYPDGNIVEVSGHSVAFNLLTNVFSSGQELLVTTIPYSMALQSGEQGTWLPKFA